MKQVKIGAHLMGVVTAAMCCAFALSMVFAAAGEVESPRLFQTTETKDFREIATGGFTIHPCAW